jgi:hypothetical protein
VTGGGRWTNRPSRHDPPLTGLEVWLNGTPTELDAATRALAATGADAGRAQLYLRLNIIPTRRTIPPAQPASGDSATVLRFPDRFSGGAA